MYDENYESRGSYPIDHSVKARVTELRACRGVKYRVAQVPRQSQFKQLSYIIIPGGLFNNFGRRVFEAKNMADFGLC